MNDDIVGAASILTLRMRLNELLWKHLRFEDGGLSDDKLVDMVWLRYHKQRREDEEKAGG